MGRGNTEVGKAGETAALKFLKKKGYKILETNARTVFGEIDIVTRLAGTIVFVEVKTRATSSLGPPYLSITRMKEKHMINFNAWKQCAAECIQAIENRNQKGEGK